MTQPPFSSDAAFLARLLESAGQAVVALGLDLRVIYWNQHAERLYGLTRAEALGRMGNEAIPTVLKVDERRSVIHALTEGRSWSGETWVLRPDGSSFPVFTVNTPILDGTGAVTGMVGVSTEITERKELENKLRFKNSVLQEQSDALEDGVLVYGLDGTILSRNRRYLEIWNITEEEARSMDSRAEVERAAAQVENRTAFLLPMEQLRGNALYVYEDELLLKSGRVVFRSGRPLMGADGSHIGRLLVFRDVTATRRAQQLVERRALQQGAVAVLGQQALASGSGSGSGSGSVEELLAEAMALMVASLGVEIAEVTRVTPEGDLRHWVSHGWGRWQPAREAAIVSDVRLARALSSGAPELLTGLGAEPLFREPVLGLSAQLDNGLVVPISAPGQLYGTLSAYARSERTFTVEDLYFVEAVANVLGNAIERRRIDEALRKSEETFRSLTEGTPDLVLVHRESRVLYANPAVLRCLGLATQSEVFGADVVSLFHLDDRPRLAPLLLGPPVRAETLDCRLLHADGTLTLVDLVALSIDFHGRPATVSFGRDTSARKQLEERLAFADRLASVGTLAAGVAHEINNPLAYVTWWEWAPALAWPSVTPSSGRSGEASRPTAARESRPDSRSSFPRRTGGPEARTSRCIPAPTFATPFPLCPSH